MLEEIILPRGDKAETMMFVDAWWSWDVARVASRGVGSDRGCRSGDGVDGIARWIGMSVGVVKGSVDGSSVSVGDREFAVLGVIAEVEAVSVFVVKEWVDAVTVMRV